ncbi:MAG: metal ABC transporter ATP-binding protein [Acidimicrobiaceae bacterium]|nr:metal ABC transporter ATP-binding protein [Acidimicrobiaceae bacterium]
MSTTIEAVHVKNLTVRFGATTAFRDVSHSFTPGATTALMGVNGSGKTTLLQCLAGLQQPTAGYIGGLPKKIAYLSQNIHKTWMPLTTAEVLIMSRYRKLGLLGRMRTVDRDAIEAASEKLAITELMKQNFGSLSGGQQQRVRIAQVLASDPELVLLDEPVTGLDIPSQKRILQVIEEWSHSGTTVILTTHHQNEAMHCQTVVVMANRLVAYGSPAEIVVKGNLVPDLECHSFPDLDCHGSHST